ncbi:enoyl-CoA hydratase/isomerase family protein [Roseomonas sp. E05]|uniref:enoyl-CoA hydratase/isomerase family protein n=1 Tax=Roseomonas sp. E05 TaxID=3046310 RepID=UPI0024B9C4F8|nr:enoyl-CoA hydratase/isomerase family protein [Roseomonas sp. E05]MDJ0387602.1 enoyl-CoA hydratase/isomerase family protein [Roseomonas sp. E05]
MAETDATLIATRQGAVGRLLMNRPRALNALDLPMIDAMAEAIAAWREDESLRLVLLEGAGDRAFCAGGDVRRVREQVLAGDYDSVEAFFSHEYAVNGAIAAFPRPWVSLIDGVCMGGGIGVAVHGSHRVVTEHAMLAMPETAIALFPDVGTSYVLPRLAGGLGRWLALTGGRLKGAEAVEAGLATHFVPRERLGELHAALLAEGDARVVERFAAPVPPGRIAALLPAIDRCFAHDERAAIESALRAEDSDWAREQLAILEHVSPTSVAVTLELLKRGAALDLPACLEMELSLTRGVTRHPDFAEGVRAVLVDKDNAPRWQPAADPVSLFG